jgi:hypothetical protein
MHLRVIAVQEHRAVGPEANGEKVSVREVIAHGQLVTSRQPGDLDAFIRESLVILESDPGAPMIGARETPLPPPRPGDPPSVPGPEPPRLPEQPEPTTPRPQPGPGQDPQPPVDPRPAPIPPLPGPDPTPLPV